MTQSKLSEPPKRRSGLLRLRLRPDRSPRVARGPDLGDKRLQLLLVASSGKE
jgi:hypothetical protein